jgi:hypothetical protein
MSLKINVNGATQLYSKLICVLVKTIFLHNCTFSRGLRKNKHFFSDPDFSVEDGPAPTKYIIKNVGKKIAGCNLEEHYAGNSGPCSWPWQKLSDQCRYFLDGFSRLRVILDRKIKDVQNCLKIRFLNMFSKSQYVVCSPNRNIRRPATLFFFIEKDEIFFSVCGH